MYKRKFSYINGLNVKLIKLVRICIDNYEVDMITETEKKKFEIFCIIVMWSTPHNCQENIYWIFNFKVKNEHKCINLIYLNREMSN